METRDPAGPGPEHTSGGAEVVTAEDGTFTIPAIATGRLEVGVQSSESLAVRPKLPEEMAVLSGGLNRLEIPLVAAVRVRGKIQVKGEGKPVPAASISVSYGSGRQGSTVVSDKEGRFETYVLPGDVRLQVIVMPENYVQLGEPWNERYKVPADVAAFDLPSIDVVPGTTIKGRLVKGKDRPVANVRIAGQVGRKAVRLRTNQRQRGVHADRRPRGLSSDLQGVLRGGWLGGDHDRHASPLLLRAGPDPGEVPAAGVAISGTVVDPQGKPVAGSKVIVFIETGRQPAGQPGGELVRQKRSTLVTDASGRYLMTFAGEKGTRFRAIATPENHTLAGSEWISHNGTDSVTFKPIRVTPLRTITGRVVDTEGRPVAAATVLNWGNPAPLTSAVTGPDGVFRLEGVPPGEFRLSVDAPGYRFHGEIREASNSPVELKIRRDDQPPARKVRPRGPVLDRPAAVELARKVIAPYSDRILDPDSDSDADARSRVLEVLAKIDPDEAWRKCQAGEPPWNHNAVRIAVARELMRTDVDQGSARSFPRSPASSGGAGLASS